MVLKGKGVQLATGLGAICVMNVGIREQAVKIRDSVSLSSSEWLRGSPEEHPMDWLWAVRVCA